MYTIQVPTTVTAYYVEGEYLGVQTDHKSGAASPTYGAYFDVEYDTHRLGCQWQFVLYDEAKAANYEAAKVLENLLNVAKEKKIGTDAEQAVAHIQSFKRGVEYGCIPVKLGAVIPRL